MMKKYFFVIHIITVLFILSACAALPTVRVVPTLGAPTDFTKDYPPLSSETISLLSEVGLLSSPEFVSPLLKVGYISEDNIVVGVYSNGGTVVGWNIDKSTLAFAHELGILTAKSLTFAASGEKVVGAMDRVLKADSLNRNIEYLNGIAVWDVRTGALLKCYAYPCQENSGEPDGFLGFAVDADLNWQAIFSERIITLLRLSDDSVVVAGEVTPIDASYQWEIGSVAFDPVNHRYAIVFQEGRVYVSDIDRPLNRRVIAKGKKGDLIAITDAQIDPTGRWLMVARGSETSVLDLDNGDILLQIDVADPVLAFDRTGELLFIGANNKLKIYSMAVDSKVSEYDTPNITSLAISEDNRLVIWGDKLGAIHIWGVQK
jgi:WD40 repeat protein